MPTQKYTVTTDKGSYEIEVEEPEVKTEKRSFAGGVADRLFGEPDTYMGGAAKGAVEGMVGGAKGFAEGVIPGAYHAVTGTPRALYDAAVGTVKGAANLVQNPSGTLGDSLTAIKGIPGKVSDAVGSAADLARKDPEEFGRQAGEQTGAAEVAIGSSRLVPLAPKPIARAVGGVMEQVGTKGAWPIRMMGAHQLGSGNPMGIATMMVPEGLKKGGAALSQLGDAPSAAALKRAPTGTRNVDAKFTKGLNLVPEPSPVPTTPRVPMTLGEAGPIGTPVSDSTITPAERAKLVKQGYTPEMIAKLEKADAPKGAATVSPRPPAPKPPVDESGGVTFDPATARQGELLQKLGGKPEAAKPLGLNTGPAHMGAGLKELGTKGSEAFRTEQFEKNAPLVDKAGVTGDRLPLGNDGLKAAQAEKEAFAQREVGQSAHPSVDIDTANPHEQGSRPSLKDLGPRPTAPSSARLGGGVDSGERVPLSSLKNSKGRISEGDYQRLAKLSGIKRELLNDNTKLPASVADAFLAERKTAGAGHYINAREDAARNAAEARDRDPR